MAGLPRPQADRDGRFSRRLSAWNLTFAQGSVEPAPARDQDMIVPSKLVDLPLEIAYGLAPPQPVKDAVNIEVPRHARQRDAPVCATPLGRPIFHHSPLSAKLSEVLICRII
jgi:hypothetical protein